jgi:hypothetical protein
MHVLLIKYILPDVAAFCPAVFDSDAFAAAIEVATFKSNGDAIAAEPTSMNFLLVKFELVSVIKISPF